MTEQVRGGGNGSVVVLCVAITVLWVADLALAGASRLVAAMTGAGAVGSPVAPERLAAGIKAGGASALWPGGHPVPVLVLAVLLLLAVLVPVAWLAVRLWSRRQARQRALLAGGEDSQAWATRHDVKALLVEPGTDRLVLGYLVEDR